MKIGFIGLGVMGRPMAKNLLKAGHALCVYDINKVILAEMVESGAKVAKSSAEVAEWADVVVTMLPNSPHVKTVVMGEKGVLSGAYKGLVLIEMSSIAPLITREVGEACEKAGVHMLEAPVSGGEPKAIDGTLSLMVGGDKELLERMMPVLEPISGSIVHCGALGAGNTTKLVNQMIIAIEMAAIGEAFAMGKKAGVDPGVIYRAIRGGFAGSMVLDGKLTMVLDGNFKPGFRLNLHIKDIGNCLETGQNIGTPMPLTSAVMDMMKYIQANGSGDLDHCVMMKYYEKLAGVELRRSELG